MNCQSAGIDTHGKRCPWFDIPTISCTWNAEEKGGDHCVYEVDMGINDAQLARAEQVGVPAWLKYKIEMVRQGIDRLRSLWSEEMYQEIHSALEIADRYRPGSPTYDSRNLVSLVGLNADIIHLHAHGTRISTMLGEARAMANTLDVQSKLMKNRKLKLIRDSYSSGYRRGRPTGTGMEVDVHNDQEFAQMLEDTSKAKEQSETLEMHYKGLVELVNALKYQITTLQEERKYVGRQPG
jgi:hypothetical protein